MAYVFPVNPYDGQLYPLPAQAGALQYQWNEGLKVWLIFSPLGVQSVSGILPIVVTNGTSDAVIQITPATINAAGSMSAADKAKLDAIPADAGPGTVTQINTTQGITGGPIRTTGTLGLAPATGSSIGGVLIGENITVASNGRISIPTASLGVQSINLGPGLVGSPSPIVSTGTISAAIASRLSIGSVRVGNGLSIAPDGTLSLGGSLGNVSVIAWGSILVTGGTTFALEEGYNISAVEWRPSDQPRVRVYFQTALANNTYGVVLTPRVPSYGSSFSKYQNNVLINYTFKEITYVDLNCVGFRTTDNTTNDMTTYWNDWATVTEFDIIVVDTAIYS